jgi:hypothetical protein
MSWRKSQKQRLQHEHTLKLNSLRIFCIVRTLKKSENLMQFVYNVSIEVFHLIHCHIILIKKKTKKTLDIVQRCRHGINTLIRVVKYENVLQRKRHLVGCWPCTKPVLYSVYTSYFVFGSKMCVLYPLTHIRGRWEDKNHFRPSSGHDELSCSLSSVKVYF